MKVTDLDTLRPEAKFIKLAGYEIDVSFVPCGIVFDLDPIIEELQTITEVEIKTIPEKAKKAFELAIKLCSVFCSHKYPNLTPEWFYENTDSMQVEAFASSIKDALNRAYNGIGGKRKNRTAPK